MTLTTPGPEFATLPPCADRQLRPDGSVEAVRHSVDGEALPRVLESGLRFAPAAVVPHQPVRARTSRQNPAGFDPLWHGQVLKPVHLNNGERSGAVTALSG